jgi:hypothetical protein
VPAEVILVFVLFAALVIGAAIWGAKKEKERRLLLAGWASHNGMRYSAERDLGMERRYPLLRMLRQGDNRYAYNVMQGAHDGRPCCAFDYHYETHSTDSKGRRQTHHHHFSAVVLETGLPLKPLFLRPETVLDRMTEAFGFDDIDFESIEFSRAFHVKAPEKRWAFDVLHQATMEFLLQAPRFHLELQGPFAAAWRSGRLAPVDFQGALFVLDGILDRLPRYVRQDLSGGRDG